LAEEKVDEPAALKKVAKEQGSRRAKRIGRCREASEQQAFGSLLKYGLK
jgi:hypothetical protein